MKKTLQLIATIVCSTVLVLGIFSCENKSNTDTYKNDRQSLVDSDSMHKNDFDKQKDESDADYLTFIKKKSEQGYPEAQLRLGIMYEQGLYGLSQSNENAKKWYLKAAKQGYSLAQYNLASLYFTEENYSKSFRWMKECAESGDYPYAQYMLAQCLINGFGCEQDVMEGLYWLEKAADQGVKGAIEDLNTFNEELRKYN